MGIVGHLVPGPLDVACLGENDVGPTVAYYAKEDCGGTTDMSPLEGLLDVLNSLRWALTAPGFRNFVVLFVGWVQTQGVHAVTSALVETDVARRVHHERFHRFFSRGTWSPDEIGRLSLVVPPVAAAAAAGRSRPGRAR